MKKITIEEFKNLINRKDFTTFQTSEIWHRNGDEKMGFVTKKANIYHEVLGNISITFSQVFDVRFDYAELEDPIDGCWGIEGFEVDLDLYGDVDEMIHNLNYWETDNLYRVTKINIYTLDDYDPV